jgi:hypothetical protein
VKAPGPANPKKTSGNRLVAQCPIPAGSVAEYRLLERWIIPILKNGAYIMVEVEEIIYGNTNCFFKLVLR